jgi:2-haloacid dehalogenase/putative hydrolase of the HAD superfamily
MALVGPRPKWLTFDCYGTLIQWDEGLVAAIKQILKNKTGSIDLHRFIEVYDRHEHKLEQERPHRSFKAVTGQALEYAMKDFSLAIDSADAEILTSSIGRMPPFPEVVETLGKLRNAGFGLAVISNTDDEIIAGNISQLGGYIDRVITAQQAEAYKPSRRIFEYAWQSLGVVKEDIVHICASPHLDLVAARDLQFRCVWINRATGRQAPADYSPNAVLPGLDQVPALFESAGWIS